MQDRKQKLLQAAGCLVCVAVAWRFVLDLDGTEFSGGRITGPLLTMQVFGSLLFALALPLTFFIRRIGAAMMLLACLLCMPLYLYFTAPGPFRWVFRGNYSVPLQANFFWDWWSIEGMAALIFAGFVCFRGFVKSGARRA